VQAHAAHDGGMDYAEVMSSAGGGGGGPSTGNAGAGRSASWTDRGIYNRGAEHGL
jgi:hypothetical protein